MGGKERSETEVLIVGAGPTGLTVACELLRRGIGCRVLDKAEAPGTTSRAMGVQARTLEVFDDMGIVEGVLSKGIKGVGVKAYSGDTLLLHMNFRFMASDAVPYPYGVMLPQNVTEELLIGLLHEEGGTVERPKEVTGIRQEAGIVTATVDDLRNGTCEEVRAGWLIGCDGAHSRVRHTLGLAFEGSTYDEEYLLGDVDLDWDRSREDVYVWEHRDGQFAAFPLPDGHWRLVANVPISDGKDAPRASVGLFQRMMRERTGDGTTKISNPIWMSNFKINRRMVASYRKGRVFLAGDAAHVHSPLGGQGMNTGIQDAYNLAWKLALVIRGQASDALLDTYQTERMPVARKVLSQTHRNTGIFFARNPVTRFVRDRVAIPLLNRGVFQRRLLWEASELGINYRTSALSRSCKGTLAERMNPKAWGKFRKAPHAGDRAPDGRCLCFPSRSVTSLFREFRGTTSHLLLFDGQVHTEDNHANLARIASRVEGMLEDEVKTHLIVSKGGKLDNVERDRSVLLDPEHALHARYGAGTPSLYFVRPDGYIGFRCRPAREEPLLDYLGSWFMPQKTSTTAVAPPNSRQGCRICALKERSRMSEGHDPIQEQLIAARRAQILDAATKVFAEKGFHRATVRDISRTAGIADGTIYNYFANKTDVLLGILDRLNETERRQEDFAQGAEQDTRDFFAAYMRRRISLLWPNAEAFRAVLPEILANPELRDLYYQQLVRPTLEIAERYFRAQIEQGRLRQIDVPLAVRSMVGNILGLLMLQLLGDQEIHARWEELPEVLVTLIFDGLNPS